MTRRTLLSSAGALAAAAAQPRAPVRLGIDLFSIRSSGWTAFEYLDYCAR